MFELILFLSSRGKSGLGTEWEFFWNQLTPSDEETTLSLSEIHRLKSNQIPQ